MLQSLGENQREYINILISLPEKNIVKNISEYGN